MEQPNTHLRQRKARITYEFRKSYRNTLAPFIRLRGHWLKEAGFDIGDDVVVKVQTNRLVLTKATTE